MPKKTAATVKIGDSPAVDIDDLEKQLDEKDAEAIAAETLTGDIRDFLLDRIKRLHKPWQQMTEEEQLGQIQAATIAAEHLVRRAVHLIAADGRKVMAGTLDSITVKGGLKAVIKLSKHDENRHALIDSEGQAVLVVVADAEPFEGEREPAKAEPNQHAMDLEEQNDHLHEEAA